MNNRKPLYAKIAIARKQLPDMTEEAYRELLANEFNGVASAAKLSWRDLNRLVDLLSSSWLLPVPPCSSRAGT